MDYEQPHQELVKCVVVGDTAVGKTRLICARACDARVSLNQLITTHVPTVWAIDQYRIDKQVLERSWDIVDGVSVSLRLWDTFGDHDRDRRYAYGRSDVVLLCFSVANPLSLRNCKDMWYPEIRKFCPHVPIILVGCKNDLRFMYRDPKYLSYFQDRSPFMKPIRECDILTPDQGRAVASEMGSPFYYETNVLTNYGVYFVFESIIRAALIARKQQKFWMTSLKRVRQPSIQIPFCPPKPSAPKVYVPASRYEETIKNVFELQSNTDVVIVTGGGKGKESKSFYAHKFFLAAAVPSMYKLFTMDLSSEIPSRRASDSSIVSSVDASLAGLGVDTERLIKEDNHSVTGCLPPCYKFPAFLSQTLSCTSSFDPEASASPSPIHRRLSLQSPSYPNLSEGVYRILNHPAFYSIHLQLYERTDEKSKGGLQTVVVLTSTITAKVFDQCLKFLHTASIEESSLDNIVELQRAARLIGIHELEVYLNNLSNNEGFLNDALRVNYFNKLQCQLKDMLNNGLFSDIVFQLDGGSCFAHKPLLMARCDVMGAMFRGDFRESSTKVVHFPGVAVDAFDHLLNYLYTDNCQGTQLENCLDIIELANKLCISRLVATIEHKMIAELTKIAESGPDVFEYAIRLLEPCQMYNANQLSDWCLHLLVTNYNDVCRNVPKLLRNLHPENQAYLNKNRWPPVWYLKECDNYDRCLREREREEKPLKALKRHQNNSNGCLCFCSKTRKNSDADKQYRTM